MRTSCGLAIAAATWLASSPCRAEDRDPAASLFTGTAVLVAGFTVGGLLIATSGDRNLPSNAGWLTMESAFTVAPLAAHGIAGEWVRGLAFSALPAASTGGTLGLFQYDPGTIHHGSLPEQRWLWAMFGISLASATAGIIDTLVLPGRAAPVAVAPSFGSGQVGLMVRGTM